MGIYMCLVVTDVRFAIFVCLPASWVGVTLVCRHGRRRVQVNVSFLEDLIHSAKEGRGEELENMVLVKGDGYVRGRDGLPATSQNAKDR